MRGRTYKARFDEAGATYIPSLGSQAPHNYPLEVELASVTVGGIEIARGGRVHQGEDVTIEHGDVMRAPR